MKKIVGTLFIFLAAITATIAQVTNDQRALSTKIADVLARFPAQNKEQLGNNLKSMAELGKAGYQEMVDMLSAPGKGNNTALEFAINAWSVHVTGAGN